MNKYKEQFKRAIENMNSAMGSEVIKGVKLNVVDSWSEMYVGCVYKHYPNEIYVNNFSLENSRIDRVYNVICHEFCHSILMNIFEGTETIIDDCWSNDNSPVFCLLVKWFNNNGFRISLNDNISKFKSNINFITKMKNKSFAEIHKFILEFRDYIVEMQKEGYLISMIREADTMFNKRYKSYKDFSIVKSIKLGNDFDLENYKEFIENIIGGIEDYDKNSGNY